MNDEPLFNFSQPPRTVPLSVKLRILFGGFTNQFGWIFFGFGLIFVWVFTLQGDYTSWYRFRGDVSTAQGVITEVKETNLSINETKVYANHYKFTDEDGNEFSDISYTTGKRVNVSNTVTIEYLTYQPQISRIQGQRRSQGGIFGLMPVIFPVVGLCFIVAGFKKANKGIHLLSLGKISHGTLKSKEKTNTKINDNPVYKFTFEFFADDGNSYQAIAKSYLVEKLEDQEFEPLLYDPARPNYAVMLDNLPGNPRIDEMGNIKCGNILSTTAVLIIPLATIIGHSWYIFTKLLS